MEKDPERLDRDEDERGWLAAPEAAARLGVKLDSLYAYVSRGLLTRRRRPGERGSWFDPSEIERLGARGRGGQREAREVRIESAVTAIEGGRYFYRGLDPVALARERSFEEVAELLWLGRLPEEPIVWSADPAAVAIARSAQRVLPATALAFDRVRLATAALAGADPFRHDLRRDAVASAARRLLATLIESLPQRRAGAARREPERFARRLWDRVAVRAPGAAQVAAIDGALVLLADHELAASTFAVRIAAAFRADPYGAVGAGFGVLGGAWHGAVSVAAEALLAEIDDAGGVAPVVDRQLRSGARLPGIGHPLYRDGDPRAPALLDLVRASAGDVKRIAQVEAFLAATRERGLPPPNVDLGIAALTHVLRLPRGTGELLFALARIAGWLAHAIEEYERPSALRPRAVYTGRRPGAAPQVSRETPAEGGVPGRHPDSPRKTGTKRTPRARSRR
jgi:citrate synthase